MARFISTYNTLTLTVQVPYTEYIGLNNRRIHAGKTIKFSRGVYETDDEAEIAFIRKHRWYGSRIIEVKPEDLQPRAAQTEDVISLPCGFDGCNYVATGKTEDVAVRKLNGHRTKENHWPKDLPEVKTGKEE